MVLKISGGWTGYPTIEVADLVGVTAGAAQQR